MAEEDRQGADGIVYAAFATTDLYEILQIDKLADDKAIKKAYKKLALKYHPDKNNTKEATQKFQALGIAHATLSDPKKREVFDKTGSLDEADLSDEFDQWYDYFRNLFPKVTVEKINAFAAEYRDSAEERKDVLQAYSTYKGNMSDILDSVMLATDDDEDRFNEMIEIAISNGEIKSVYNDKEGATARHVKRLTKSQKRRRAAQNASEQSAAEDTNRELSDLTALIQSRQHSRSSILSQLEARYAKPSKSTGKKRSSKSHQSMPSEEEFQKVQKNMGKKRSKKGN